MKKFCSMILSLMILLTCMTPAVAQEEMSRIVARSFGVANGVAPDSVVLMEDGSVLETYENVTEEKYRVFCKHAGIMWVGDKHDPDARTRLVNRQAGQTTEYNFYRTENRFTAQYYPGTPFETLDGTDPVDNLIKLHTQAAQEGNAESMYVLGLIFSQPEYGRADMEEAVDWLTRSYVAGNVRALTALGCLYLYPEYGMQDVELAIAYLERAFARGDSSASVTLGGIYSSDDYGLFDLEKLFGWCHAGAVDGNCTQMRNLAMLYCEGIYVARDVEKAVEWLERAARRDDSKAMLQLGQMYESQEYSIHNDQLAHHWYLKAAEAGNDEAVDWLTSAPQPKDN